jgi:hypothetical protein
MWWLVVVNAAPAIALLLFLTRLPMVTRGWAGPPWDEGGGSEDGGIGPRPDAPASTFGGPDRSRVLSLSEREERRLARSA